VNGAGRETDSGQQMIAELEALKLAGISVFAVALSSRADETDARSISSVPQLVGVNYFVSPAITNLSSISHPLAAQVLFYDLFVQTNNAHHLAPLWRFREFWSGIIMQRK